MTHDQLLGRLNDFPEDVLPNVRQNMMTKLKNTIEIRGEDSACNNLLGYCGRFQAQTKEED